MDVKSTKRPVPCPRGGGGIRTLRSRAEWRAMTGLVPGLLRRVLPGEVAVGDQELDVEGLALELGGDLEDASRDPPEGALGGDELHLPERHLFVIDLVPAEAGEQGRRQLEGRAGLTAPREGDAGPGEGDGQAGKEVGGSGFAAPVEHEGLHFGTFSVSSANNPFVCVTKKYTKKSPSCKPKSQ